MKRVWLDAGHGGKDPGATGHGLQEKDIALVLSLAIKDKLESEYEDVQVGLSRSTDVFLELKERSNKANAAGADILVSIHCNAGGGAGGFESFRYTSASIATADLQHALHTEIMSALKSYGVNDRGQKAANLHMCRESRMPAVLTENLFIDVKNDADKLKQTDIIKLLVNGHAIGIAKYLGLRKKDVLAPINETTVKVIINGKLIENVKQMDQVTYVPLRTICDALGAKVSWDHHTKTATVSGASPH
ncbi:N-acetylmuramoyl-L-alanine amidase [Fontibacillus panacisegetis]|uniref:N-acetylmuramoyl-L-alanine amidase n=1 Tax=Fontibacillus panacisegetis TaxID=670482 RepID=A0A1G7G1D6_9BACL|nr:N-acetylmuramoyl-L-alanine amidase [Fontibacillus panacisegetis]SDE82004.1 N-acetylmuramoyl-L-alanine amidase [Fontibacillus panacisegetis]